MSMKIVYSMAVIICAAMWFGSCQNEELDYYPLEKKHLGETYTEYVMNNIISNDTVSPEFLSGRSDLTVVCRL
mgnify:CR=1 FL=1